MSLPTRPNPIAFVVLLGAMFGVVTFFANSRADDAPKPTEAAQAADPVKKTDLTLEEFMRRKLDASNQILEGLTTDDMPMVVAGARKLHEMSVAERWRVSNDPLYRQFSADFRETTLGLIKAAEEGNADRAAMKWMDATMSCLDCHRFVRGAKVAAR
ncbi:MAG: hypothetical protein R3B90_22635 [Planctomycetaceae bacterium]